MSSNVSTTPADQKRKGKGVPPQWDEAQMRSRTRILVFTGITAIVVIWIALFIWVFFIAPIVPTVQVEQIPPGANFFLVLAPVIAAATGVERLLESIFNTLENVWRTGVAYLGYGMRWLKRVETEVADARQWMQNLGTVYSNIQAIYADEMNQLMQQPNVQDLAGRLEALKQKADQGTANIQKLLAEAETRVTQVEEKLAESSNSPDYRNAKAAISVVLGLMFGVIVAAFGQIKMFALLGIAMPARIDVFVTGLVIGSGSYPVHSLVGILQQSKDALDGLGDLLDSRAAPTVQAVEQRITTIQPTVPGQPPMVGQAVIQTTAAQSPEAKPGS